MAGQAVALATPVRYAIDTRPKKLLDQVRDAVRARYTPMIW